MSEGNATFELVQNGMVVASASGPRTDAWREIWRYAGQYGPDGPVTIKGDPADVRAMMEGIVGIKEDAAQ
jgi:hypothetical protein